MAIIYVKSTTGSNAFSGATWLLAKATIAGALAIAVPGDIIYVSQAHAFASGAVAITWTSAGTMANPISIVCANDSAEPPTALATSATESATGNFGLTTTGSLYVYGLGIQVGSGSSGTSAFITQNNTSGHIQTWEECAFRLNTTAATQMINPTATATSATCYTLWKNCTVRFGQASQAIEVQRGRFEIDGGGVESGGTSPTAIFKQTSATYLSSAQVTGFDMSNCSAGVNIAAAGTGPCEFLITNSKLPASWSGSLVSGSLVAGSRYRMHNVDSADTNYRLIEAEPMGATVSETTIVKTGGAAVSRKMVSNAGTTYPSGLLVSPPSTRLNTTVGSPITVTVGIIRDSASDLTDAEIWLEVEYLGTSGFPLGVVVSDAKADFLTAAAAQASSSATWTTTGMANPNEQELSVTFTPQEIGMLMGRVCLAKASATVYYDQIMVVT